MFQGIPLAATVDWWRWLKLIRTTEIKIVSDACMRIAMVSNFEASEYTPHHFVCITEDAKCQSQTHWYKVEWAHFSQFWHVANKSGYIISILLHENPISCRILRIFLCANKIFYSLARNGSVSSALQWNDRRRKMIQENKWHGSNSTLITNYCHNFTFWLRATLVRLTLGKK